MKQNGPQRPRASQRANLTTSNRVKDHSDNMFFLSRCLHIVVIHICSVRNKHSIIGADQHFIARQYTRSKIKVKPKASMPFLYMMSVIVPCAKETSSCMHCGSLHCYSHKQENLADPIN